MLACLGGVWLGVSGALAGAAANVPVNVVTDVSAGPQSNLEASEQVAPTEPAPTAPAPTEPGPTESAPTQTANTQAAPISSSGKARPGATLASDLVIDHSAQRPALIPTSQFVTRSKLRFAKLSPDGTLLATFIDFPNRSAVLVNSADSERPEAMLEGQSFAIDQGFTAVSFQWAGNGRVIMSGHGIESVYGRRSVYYFVRRFYVADIATGTVRRLIENPFIASDANILAVNDAGTYALIAHATRRGEIDNNRPAVYRYDLTQEAKPVMVQTPVNGISDWTVDDTGEVRLGIGVKNGRLNVFYRETPGGELIKVRDLDLDDADQIGAAMRLGNASSVAYSLRSVGDAPVGLHKVDFSTGQVVETLYQNRDWDVDDVWFRDDEPIAISYTDDAQRIVWFKDEDRELYDALHQALGGGALRLVVTSRSRDNERMLIWAGNEADPGVLYLFDREKRDLRVLSAMRPTLDFELLARPQPITYIARDATPIAAYLTLPRGREPRGLPLVIMPHGGPFGVRDTLSYNDEVQLLANRGYAVLQPNFRGSGGYGDAFYQLGEGEIGRAMQDDLDDAMDWAVEQGIAAADRVCVAGGSYGGYAALWAVLRNPERYRCAASWAGVTDFDEQLRYDRKYLSREGRRDWREQIEGGDDFDLKQVSPMQMGGRLNRPVLLAHGVRDLRVPFSQYLDMLEATEEAPVPPTTLVLEMAGHSFTRTRDEQFWYSALEGLLAKHNPADLIDTPAQGEAHAGGSDEAALVSALGARDTGGDTGGDTGFGRSTDQNTAKDTPVAQAGAAQ